MPEKPTNRIGKKLEVTPSWAIGLGLSLLGLSLVLVANSCWTWLYNLSGSLPALAAAFGEALLVAGLLAMLVDPFLKARLLREASRNLFEHIIGFDHEPEIKQRLRDIVFQTKLYRTNSRICFAVAADAENTVSIQLTLEYELVNESLDNVPFTQFMIFEKADSPSNCELTSICNGKPRIAQPDFKEREPGVLEAKADEVTIEPRSRGQKYQFTSRCQLKAPRDFYHPIHFLHPTIGVAVSVEAPEGWQVSVSRMEKRDDKGLPNKGVWYNAGLLMPGDHVEIRWQETAG